MKTLKTLFTIIFLTLISLTGFTQTSMYNMKSAGVYLTGIDKKVKDSDSFTFKALTGKKYEIVISSTEPVTITSQDLEISLNGKEDKRFTVTGNGQLITLTIETSKKASVVIGVYFLGS